MANELPVVPKGMQAMGWIASDMDCCVEKVIGEYSAPFKERGIINVVVHDSKVGELMNYVPQAVIAFRIGAGKEGAGHVDEVIKCLLNFRNLRVKTFYYTDDLIFGANGWAPIKVINVVDEVIVSSPSIKEFLQGTGCGKPIHVVETHLFVEEFDSINPNPGRYNPNKVKVLWTSSGRVGIKMLNLVADRLNKDPDKYSNVQLVMAAGGVAQVRSTINHFRDVDKVYIDWLGKLEFYSYLKACNIVLSLGEAGDLDYMLPGEYQKQWLDSKSAVKYCLAGGAKLPIITQTGMAMYDKAIEHGKTGYKASNLDEIMQYIDLLKGDADLRRSIGEAARADVVEHYDLGKRTDELLAILQSKVQSTITSTPSQGFKKCWLPSIAGGPRTFHNMISKYLPKISHGRWGIVPGHQVSVDAAIILAYVGAGLLPTLKELNPKCKVISRVDGLPTDFHGNMEGLTFEAMKKIIVEADEVVWQSKHCRKLWSQYIDTQRGVVIHNGVDLEIYSRAGESYLFPGDKPSILCVNFSTFPHKRRDLLEQIITETPNVKFHIVGHYADIDLDVEKKVWAKYGNVEYLGPIYNNPSALAKLYRGATALLFTSEMEGSPNTVLEATACGCPIIYNARADIVPEILGDLAKPVMEPKEFYNVLYPLLDVGTRKILQDRLESRAEQYSAEVCAYKYLRILDKEGVNV